MSRQTKVTKLARVQHRTSLSPAINNRPGRLSQRPETVNATPHPFAP